MFSDFLDLSFDFSFSFLNFFLSYHNLLEINGVVNKAAVPFNESSKLVMLAVFRGVLFQVKSNHSTSLEFNRIISLYCEYIGGRRYPFVLRVVIMFRNDFDFGSHEERRIEADTELSDKVEFSSFEVL